MKAHDKQNSTYLFSEEIQFKSDSFLTNVQIQLKKIRFRYHIMLIDSYL